MKITPIIGLEVHVELKTKTKMFCSCKAEHFHVEPNTHTCPVCLGLPGALPVPNLTACEWCLKLGLALNCTPNETSFFERKNYFYPDLPKGYQITQYEKPFVINGFIMIGDQKVRINRAHMEEDTGKSIHLQQNGQDITLIDLNRAGVPLVEIVSEPDISSPEMAKEYLLKIQQIIRYLGISDADIEKGSMRCEPTVNLKIEKDDETFYTPLVEIKNVASLTGVQNAIQFEIDRQAKEFEETHEVKNFKNKTTRGWDADKNQTFLQREKEGSSDYRYFPEPDIPHIEFTQEQIEKIRESLPELPDEKIERYKTYKLSDYDADLIAQDIKLSGLFEEAIKQNNSPDFIKGTANLINSSIRQYINENPDLSVQISPSNLGAAVNAVLSNQISSTVAKEIVYESCKDNKNTIEIAKEKNLIQISDTNEIEKIAKQVITDNPKAVEDYKKNPASIGFLIGQVMKMSKGSANPQLAKEILERLIKKCI